MINFRYLIFRNVVDIARKLVEGTEKLGITIDENAMASLSAS